jgi:hypothetical protein
LAVQPENSFFRIHKKGRGFKFHKSLMGEDGSWSHHHIFDWIYLSVPRCEDFEKSDPSFDSFSTEGVFTYKPFCDDFGPMNLGSVCEFCMLMVDKIRNRTDRPISMITLSSKRNITNAVFLLGSYLIIILKLDTRIVTSLFRSLQDELLSYRDVSPGKQNFSLYLDDCWGGVQKASALGWVDFRLTKLSPSGLGFDLESY